jgi:hypothetical protein
LVLVAHRAQVKAAEFQIKSATIPVVGGLHRGVLQEVQIGIEADVRGGAESLLAGVAVAEQEPELVELLRKRSRGGSRGLGRHLQEGIATANGQRPQTVVEQYGARGHVAQREVIIHVPLNVCP